MLVRSSGLSVVDSSLRLLSSSKLNLDRRSITSEWVEKILGIKSLRHIYGMESTSFENFVMNKVK
jgi:hypothetical protein